MRHEIVVGLDKSPSGQAALKWAAERAKEPRHRITGRAYLTGRTASAPSVFPRR